MERQALYRRCGFSQGVSLGKACAREIGESLSHSGICVISVAWGIDAAALRGSLRGPIPPIAILGNGLPQIYPPENRGLAEETSLQEDFWFQNIRRKPAQRVSLSTAQSPDQCLV